MLSTDSNRRLYTSDEIQAMSGRELYGLMNKYKDLLYTKQIDKRDVNRSCLEIEFCYLQRELQKREKWNLAFDKNRRGE